jgi:hypothetical protein
LVLTAAPQLATADKKDGESAVVFRWQALPNAASYIIEISEDRSFSKVIVRESVTTNAYPWRRLARKNYYYRVRAVGKDGRKGRFSPVRVMRLVVTPPKITSPRNGAVFRIGSRDARVRVSWAKEELLSKYVVEIATSKNFGTVEHNAETAKTSHSFSVAKAGEYFVRVSGVDLNGKPIKAKASRRFRVDVGAPEPRKPGPGTSVPMTDATTTVELGWSKRPVNSYQVQWGHSPKLGHGAQSARSPTEKHTIDVTAVETVYWRVRGRSPDTKWSKTSEFAMSLPSPETTSPSEGQVLIEPAVTAAWTPVPGADHYIVEVAPIVEDGSPPQLVTSKVPGAVTASLQLPGDGDYSVTVTAIDPAGTPSPPSPAINFTVKTPARLAVPTLRGPQSRETSVSGENAAFEWSPVEGADDYTLQVCTDPNFRSPTYEQTVTRPHAQVMIKKAGQYFWRVRARTGANISEWSSQRVLDVVAPPPSPGRRTQLAVAPVFGLVHNFGEVFSPTVMAEVSTRPSWLPAAMRLSLGVGWYASSTEFTDEGTGIMLDSKVHVLPVELKASWLVPGAGFNFYGGPQVGVAVVFANVEGEAQPKLTSGGVQVGGGVHVGAEKDLGPGAAFVETGYGFHSKLDGIVEIRPGGLVANVGYRIGIRK